MEDTMLSSLAPFDSLPEEEDIPASEEGDLGDSTLCTEALPSLLLELLPPKSMGKSSSLSSVCLDGELLLSSVAPIDIFKAISCLTLRK